MDDQSSQPSQTNTKSYQETLVMPLDSPEFDAALTRREDNAILPHTATELEKRYYLNIIKGKHGDSRYRFEEKLISGGMGAIFKVWDKNLQRPSAMKVILPQLKNKGQTLKNFITEARVTGLLEHPNIMPVHDIGLLPEIGLYFTMKLARGESLEHIVNQIREGNSAYVRKYSLYRLLSIFRKVCDAISFAHSVNIIHQDIKPSNIMVGRYGEVLLLDWGLARFVGDFEEVHDWISEEFLAEILEFSEFSEDSIQGSPPYMAPEQINNPHSIDKRTDVFLLGATLYHILTHEPPYNGKTVYEILYKAEKRELIAPEQRNPDVDIPRELSQIIMKAMAYHREDRYASVEELINDMDDLMSGRWKHQEQKRFAKGQLIMAEGEPGNEAYLILKGKVQVFKEIKGKKVVLGVLKEGDIFGEMSLITQERRTASVIALEHTEVAVFTSQVLSQTLNKMPPYLEKIISTITARLKHANERITRQSVHHPMESSDYMYSVLGELMEIFRRTAKKGGVRMSVRQIEEQLAASLSIPIQIVKDILARALNLKLIIRRSDNILAPDMSEMTQFLELAKTIGAKR